MQKKLCLPHIEAASKLGNQISCFFAFKFGFLMIFKFFWNFVAFFYCFGCKRRYVCQILRQFPIWEAKSLFFAFKFGFLMILSIFFAILVFLFFGCKRKYVYQILRQLPSWEATSLFFSVQIWFSIDFKHFLLFWCFFQCFAKFDCRRRCVQQILR